MAADTAGFRAQFPEFTDSSVSDAQVDLALQEARLIHSRRALATLYCAAHIIKLNQSIDSNVPGEVSSAKVGPITAAYKTQADKNWQVFFTRTEYGRHFLILEQRTARSGIGAMVIR